ncbi:MAG TPA: acetyl-CoA acetyltransferase [Caulobacteraceae bacterium]
MLKTTPVLIGAAQITYRGAPADAPTPLSMIIEAAESAARDAGLAPRCLAALDAIGVVGFTIDAPGSLARLAVPRLTNPPRSLAKSLGADPRLAVYTHMGGNSPQQLINSLCERIACGESDLALAVGAEFLGSLMRKLAQGLPFDGYGDDEADPPERIGDPRPGVTDREAAHGLGLPVNIYPMFENALRARDGRSLADHQRRLGELFSPFTEVAAANPYAWFPTRRSAEALTTVGPDNRMIGYPYPKYLNAIMQVDQAAGVLITSVAKARALGVPQDRWVFLHGCADAADLWYPLERQNYHSSPAMRMTGQRALAMAGIGLDDLDMVDLYSCFPSAVEIGAEELGLAVDDPRGLTVTGGLPYFGGPGNNYAMHSVATMIERLRAKPGAWGLATANGWYLTKQSTGVYSTTAPQTPFERENPAVIQSQIDALPHPQIVDRPTGAARIETYTVVHAREGYRMGIVIGRDAQGRRFVANTPSDEATLRGMESAEQVGRQGTVRLADDGLHNLFTPD